MLRLTDTAAIQAFRVFLDENAYNTSGLTESLGRARPPGPGEQQQMFDDSREITTANVLVRLFLLGTSLDEDTVTEFLPKPVRDFCFAAGLLEEDDDLIRASVVIIPVEDLLFASDAYRLVGTSAASGFVLPASTHASNFLRLLTMREPVETALDIGCGCGIQALFLARHAREVIATDISPEALRYTEFNAALNGIKNVVCIEGSLFEPVTDRSFDLIVSNPPFVLAPGETFTYRDNPLELDDFCRLLIEQAPDFLNEGGYLQILCELVDLSSANWEQRLTGWIRGCDAWVLHATPVAPAAYIEKRSTDVSGDGIAATSVSDWEAYFTRHAVQAIHPVALALRRRTDNNWLHVQNLTSDVQRESGTAVAAGFQAVDFLEACDDDALGDAMLGIADELQAKQTESGDVYLWLDNGIATEAEIDGAVAAFLNLFNGDRSVNECIMQFATVANAEAAALRHDLLAIVRVLMSRGFVVPR